MERGRIRAKTAVGVLLALLACLLLVLPIAYSGESGLAFAKSPASAKATEKPKSPPAASTVTELDESKDPEQPEETPIEVAKRLILKLPYDPDEILSYNRELAEAEAAYGGLDPSEQVELDATDMPGRQNYTYGRHLETAQWGLLAQQPIDSSVGLADRDYTPYVSSSSSMGKSTSPRGRTWSVVKFEVFNGQAWATVRCGAVSTFKSMRVGGFDYPVEYVDDVPQFEVPIVMNGTTTFTVDISDAAVSVAYQITTKSSLEVASEEDASSAIKDAKAAIESADTAYEKSSAKAVKQAAYRLLEIASLDRVTVQELSDPREAFDSAVRKAKSLQERINLGNATVEGIADCVYTGKPQTFNLIVKVDDNTLKQGVDYVASYSNNVKVGTGIVTIEGKGNYKGSIKVAFKIRPAGSSDGSSSAASPGGTNNQNVPNVTGNKGATGTGNNQTPPSVSSSKSNSPASASKSAASSSKTGSSASSESATAEVELARDGASSESQSDEIEKAVQAARWSEVIAAGLVIALLLGGMCVQTFRHVRAKEVSR